MKMIFTRRFEAAHRLLSDKSLKCQMPHGHSFQVKVSIESTNPQPLDNDVNMVEEFGAAKKKWHNWIDECVDHSMMFNSKDPMWRYVKDFVPHGRILLTPGDPTTEMVCVLFMAKCNAFLIAEHGNKLRCTHIEVVETATNSVSFDGDPHQHISTAFDAWWNRADNSTRADDSQKRAIARNTPDNKTLLQWGERANLNDGWYNDDSDPTQPEINQ